MVKESPSSRYSLTTSERVEGVLRHQNRKQIEPRFLSHISGDANFMGAYIDGRDLYSEIASSTFKKPIEECGDGSVWRKQAKVVLLG